MGRSIDEHDGNRVLRELEALWALPQVPQAGCALPAHVLAAALRYARTVPPASGEGPEG